VLGASAGAAVPPSEYAAKARAICDRHGVLYIDDEVMTGFGRTGAWFGLAGAFESAGFREVARRSATRPVMRYVVRGPRATLPAARARAAARG